MELAPTIVLTVGLVFVSILGVHAFRHWNQANASSIRLSLVQEHQHALDLKDQEMKILQKAVYNWSQRYRTLKKGYTFEPEEEDLLDESEADPEDPDKLSEFAKVLYPKLPPAIAKIIDDDNFQEAIVRTAQKNSTGISALLEKFLKPSEQGSESNTPPKLKEVYG